MAAMPEGGFLRRLVVALIIGLVSLLGDIPQAVTVPIVSSASLPSAFPLGQVFVAGGQLVLTGSQYSRSASVTTCYEAKVNPSSLDMSGARLTACDNVELDGATVAPFVSSVKIGYGELRIGRLVSRAGGVKLGPVLASYQFDSGTHLEWVYGPGSLWLYEEGTAQGPRVFRVSSTTGQLLQSTPVPGFVRPLITADANGLYVAGAGSFGGTGSTLMYRVAPGARSAQVVYSAKQAEAQYVSWVTSDGDDLWADICHRPAGAPCEIWRFNGPNLAPVFHVSDHGRTGSWVLGDEASGLYSSIWAKATLAPGATTTNWQVIRIDPRSGGISDVAELMLPAFWQGPDDTGPADAVIYGSCLYLVVPGPGGTGGDLYRVRL
jgi:hypothetical protein